MNTSELALTFRYPVPEFQEITNAQQNQSTKLAFSWPFVTRFVTLMLRLQLLILKLLPLWMPMVSVRMWVLEAKCMAPWVVLVLAMVLVVLLMLLVVLVMVMGLLLLGMLMIPLAVHGVVMTVVHHPGLPIPSGWHHTARIIDSFSLLVFVGAIHRDMWRKVAVWMPESHVRMGRTHNSHPLGGVNPVR